MFRLIYMNLFPCICKSAYWIFIAHNFNKPAERAKSKSDTDGVFVNAKRSEGASNWVSVSWYERGRTICVELQKIPDCIGHYANLQDRGSTFMTLACGIIMQTLELSLLYPVESHIWPRWPIRCYKEWRYAKFTAKFTAVRTSTWARSWATKGKETRSGSP